MDVFDWKKWILSDVKTICICWLKTHCFRCGFIKNLSPFYMVRVDRTSCILPYILPGQKKKKKKGFI